MDKKQKIWLAVFSAMFLIPEILWNGIFLKFIYYWLLNGSVQNGIKNFSLFNPIKNPDINKLFNVVEFIGTLGNFIFILFFYKPKNKIFKFLLLSFFVLMLLIAISFIAFVSSLSNLP